VDAHNFYVTICIVLHCFLQKKFFNATVKKNILKGKTSYKGNVKTRLLVGSTTVFDPKQLCQYFNYNYK